MTRYYALAVLLATAAWRGAAAQRLPFAVTIVDWERGALERQGRAYRAEAGRHEVLFCVDAWKTLPAEDGIGRIVITSARRAKSGKDHTIVDIDGQCTGPNREALPMIHTHSDGNCQFSPDDLVNAVDRRAPFEGVQCGERHFIWAFRVADTSDRQFCGVGEAQMKCLTIALGARRLTQTSART